MVEMSIYNEICGVIHVHFPLKKGKYYIPFIANEGKKAGLDFVILTSHTPKKKWKYRDLFKFEGYYDDLLIIKGEEIDERKKNHLIIIGEKKWTNETIERILKREDLVKLVAHPYGKHRLFFVKKNYSWKRWKENFDGIEVWSLLFQWADKTRIYNVPVRYLKFPYNVDVPEKIILEKWDKLNSERKVIGFAGLDIHSLPFYFRVFDFRRSFRYKNVFKTLRNHIYLKEKLTGDFQIDKEKVLNAIRNGNLFFANDFLNDSCGFYFGEKYGKYLSGEEGKIGDIILIRNPVSAKTKLLRNGRVIEEGTIKEKEIKIEKEGNYRVEVYWNDKNWIFSNYIYIKGEKNGEEKI
ncbi:MAG: hypothetical protein NC915_00325 [Candidatus Omnitrophica bacterium]|nr:hypothetical protein [Candidatus Omnitrophota bacterium]